MVTKIIREQESIPAAESILAVSDLTVIYNGEPALEDVNFEVNAGESVAIIGPNGAGKSTLIKAIMGLLQPRSGQIAIKGGSVQQIGYVPQNEAVNWEFPVTVHDVVMMGCTRQIGWFRWPGYDHRQIVASALKRVGMSEFAGRQ